MYYVYVFVVWFLMFLLTVFVGSCGCALLVECWYGVCLLYWLLGFVFCSFARCFVLLGLITWFVIALVAIGLLIVLFSLLCDLMFCGCCFDGHGRLLFVIVALRVC